MSREIDEQLEQMVCAALSELLHEAGFAGGVLMAVTPAGRLLVASSLEANCNIKPEDLLRAALHRMEASPEPGLGAPPMNE